jgi:hypothetical protein
VADVERNLRCKVRSPERTVKAGAVSSMHAEGHAVAIMKEAGIKEAILDI